MAEKPPLSIRLGEERHSRVDAHMLRTGLKLRAAVLDLVDTGLETEESVGSGKNPSKDPPPPARRKLSAAEVEAMTAPNKGLKKLLAGAEARVGVKPAKLDTSMVQVGPPSMGYGDLVKGPKAPKGKR